jgi:23S rRNA-/tRNA-specific pseudouridylate synthase
VGEPDAAGGGIEAPLRREELFGSDRPRVRVDRDRGRTARTSWRVLETSRGLSLLEVRPRTGRTHQIRVHLRHLGFPIVGDPTYGDRGINRIMRGKYALWRQWLHAREVRLAHPVTGEDLCISAPLPEELLRVLEGEGFQQRKAWTS